MKLPSRREVHSPFPISTFPANQNVDLENVVVGVLDHEDKGNISEDDKATRQEVSGFLITVWPPWVMGDWSGGGMGTECK